MAAKNEKAIIGVEDKTKEREEHSETMLANQVSIMDLAHQHNFVINYEDEKIAKIQDILTEGEITVFKENNTWSIPENEKLTGGRTIRFAARMLEMESLAASDYLVENRTKYKSAQEYNDAYMVEHKVATPVGKVENVEVKAADVKTTAKNTIKPEQEENNFVTRTKYTKEQLAEIIAGAKHGVDIKVYDNIELSHLQMRELRIGLQEGVNLSKFALKNVQPEYIKEVRLAAKDGLDIKPFTLKKKTCVYTAEQAREIRLGMKNNLTSEQVKIYMKPDLSSSVMKELRLGLQDGLDMNGFNNGIYTSKDIHTYRMHMLTKQFIESIKEKLTLLYTQICSAIKEHLSRSNPDLSKQEITTKADFEINNVVKELYENIEESISEKSVEEKKEILAGVFQKVVAIGNAIEEVYPEDDKATAFEKAAEKINENIQENNLKKRALNALKIDYLEKFNASENNYNVEVADLSQQVMEEKSLTSEQKRELLQETLGKQIGEDALEQIIDYFPEPKVLECSVAMQDEILEYIEDFELEQ